MIPQATAKPAPSSRFDRLRPGSRITFPSRWATTARPSPTMMNRAMPAPIRAHSGVTPNRSAITSPNGPLSRKATITPSTSPARSSSSFTKPRIHPRRSSPAR